MSLYLKYRPASVNELDLTHVREAIEQIVEKGNLSHAYLFDGPRGSGKTSAARILAKIANCENNDDVGKPCGKCEVCLAIENGSAVDLIEIDAASNRGIDDIRDLKQKIKLAPSNMRNKVYIIDEVHMLTTEAFNALLKTLEEPPEHAFFVLCTTEPQKLPETIISRCTRIKFRKANKKEMMRSLSRVAEGEGLDVDDDALEFLAVQVDGSFRDGVKVLDQVSDKKKKINKEMVEKVLYGVAGHNPRKFVESMIDRDLKKGLKMVREASDAGLDMEHFLRSGMYLIRDGMLNSLGIESDVSDFKVGRDGVGLVRKMDDVLVHLSDSSTPDLLVEMMVIDWCGEVEVDDGGDMEDEEEEEEKEERFDGKKEEKKAKKKKVKDGKVNGVKRKKVVKGNRKKKVSLSEKEVKSGWKELLKQVNGNYSLEALVSSARAVGVDGDTLIVKVAYAFHKRQLESLKYYKMVESLVEKAYGERDLKVRFELDESVRAKKVKKEKGEQEDGDELVETAKEIFSV